MSTTFPTRRQQRSQPLAATQMTDEQLLLGYRAGGSPDLFAELVRRYERELYSYLRRYLGDAEMAEDAFQGTFLQVHLKCDRFEPGRKVRPWLYTVATNQAIDAQRRNKRHRLVSLDRAGGGRSDELAALVDLLVSHEPDPHAAAEKVERGRWVRQTMQQLPEHMQAVVNLVYYQGLKYREAAEVLAVPVGTVKSRLHAAISRLNEAWNCSQQQQN